MIKQKRIHYLPIIIKIKDNKNHKIIKGINSLNKLMFEVNKVCAVVMSMISFEKKIKAFWQRLQRKQQRR